MKNGMESEAHARLIQRSRPRSPKLHAVRKLVYDQIIEEAFPNQKQGLFLYLDSTMLPCMGSHSLLEPRNTLSICCDCPDNMFVMSPNPENAFPVNFVLLMSVE